MFAHDIHKWDQDVSNQLAQIGFFELLGTDGIPDDLGGSTNTTRILKFRRGEGSNGSMVTQLSRSLEQITKSDLPNSQLFYAGLIEAMTNVNQHAYMFGSRALPPGMSKPWWITGSFDPTTRALKAIIVDRGAGIPSTLTRTGRMEQVRLHLGKAIPYIDDHLMIMAAMIAKRSRTQREGRGNGLANILEFVERHGAGKLRIFSRMGTVEKDANQTAKAMGNQHSVNGTLIEWQVTI